jgi:hypothetical protein
MTSSLRRKFGVRWIGFHFFFSFDFVLPEERPRRLSGGSSEGDSVVSKTSCCPQFYLCKIMLRSSYATHRATASDRAKSRSGQLNARTGGLECRTDANPVSGELWPSLAMKHS